jgi:hypothetical protein
LPTGDVQLTILDGQGTAVVPLQRVQAKLGCCSIGTNFQIVATRDPATLVTNQGYGPLVEAGALICAAGGLALSVKVPLTTKGALTGAITRTGTGTSLLTTTLDGPRGAFDDYYVKLLVTLGGTIGTGPAAFQLSMDAGRTYGPVIQLGAANTYLIPNTGITLNFAAGSLVTGDTYTFHTTGPIWADADVQTALNTLAASQYGVTGWGSLHIVGNGGAASGNGGVPAPDMQTIQGYLDTLATNQTYTRAIIEFRDAGPPVLYGGSAETDANWYGSVTADMASLSAKRICPCAGHYNMNSAIAKSAVFGQPRYRRNLAWSVAARAVAIAAQVMESRVQDGSLSQIQIDAVNDPLDGFVYHDDGSNGPLDTARITAARSRKRLPGFYVSHPNLASPLGSDFNWLPKGKVMDVASAVFMSETTQAIDREVRVNANGTIVEQDALTIEQRISKAVDNATFMQRMTSSGCSVVIDRTANISSTSKAPIKCTIFGLGYIDEIDGTIGFNSLS